jgi:hypothetical protein
MNEYYQMMKGTAAITDRMAHRFLALCGNTGGWRGGKTSDLGGGRPNLPVQGHAHDRRAHQATRRSAGSAQAQSAAGAMMYIEPVSDISPTASTSRGSSGAATWRANSDAQRCVCARARACVGEGVAPARTQHQRDLRAVSRDVLHHGLVRLRTAARGVHSCTHARTHARAHAHR